MKQVDSLSRRFVKSTFIPFFSVATLMLFQLSALAQYVPTDDSDNDSYFNWQDIDDDNDGIPDIIEQGVLDSGFVNPIRISATYNNTVTNNNVRFSNITIDGNVYSNGEFIMPTGYQLSPTFDGVSGADELFLRRNRSTRRDYLNDAGSWETDALDNISSNQILRFQGRNSNSVSNDNYFILNYDGILSAPNKYIVFTDLAGDDSLRIEAYDANDNLLTTSGSVWVGRSLLEYFETDITSGYLGQKVFMTTYPITDFAPWGSTISYLKIFWDDTSGAEGKVYVLVTSAIGEEMPDQDGDGIPNNIDLDSDNDGIVDILEAGGADVDNDGRQDGLVDTDQDGLSDLYDTDNTSAALATLLPIFDLDNDNISGYLDLDSDNDGIADIFEVEGTDANGDGYVDDYDPSNPASFVSSGNGYSDDYEGTIVLINAVDNDGNGFPESYDRDTDGNGFPDIVDLDSDNDGCNDVRESGISALFSNPDPDGNGIFGQENGDEIYDNNGQYDTNENGWHDWIENQTFVYSDFDENGIPDFRDSLVAISCTGTADYGDAPIGIGVVHLISNYDALTNTSDLMLGSTIDADLTPISDVNATEDDDNLLDDEDALDTYPFLTAIRDEYTVWVDVTNNTGSDAYLAGWIDFDFDGEFSSDECVSTVVATSDTKVRLYWDNLTDFQYGTTYLRLRISEDPNDTLSAIGMANSGEVEDYVFDILYTEACPSDAFIVQGGSTWYNVDLGTGVSRVGVDNTTKNINAIGFNVIDGLFYGYNSGDRDGRLTITTYDTRVDPPNYITFYSDPIVGLPTGTNYYVGDVGDGKLFISSGSANTGQPVYVIDVDPDSPTYLELLNTLTIFYGPLGEAYNRTDFVYFPDDSTIYALDNDGDLHTLDPETGESNLFERDVVPDRVDGRGVVFGAQYVGSKNYIYASENNSGNIYRVHLVDHTGGLFSVGPTSSSNDGAKCPEDDICFDFGDAPRSYGTLTEYEGIIGARHEIIDYNILTQTAPLAIGLYVSHENDGAASADASADDTNAVGGTIIDDEDGVTLIGDIIEAGSDFTVSVHVTDSNDVRPWFYAWIDWNQDSTFSADELVLKERETNGPHPITVSVDPESEGGFYFARIRLSTDSILGPIGPAPDGEVEDYMFYMEPRNDAPFAVNDTFDVDEDVTGSFNIVHNDFDIDGDLLANTIDVDTLTAGQQSSYTTANGVWSVVDSSISFTPFTDFNGVDSINYTIE